MHHLFRFALGAFLVVTVACSQADACAGEPGPAFGSGGIALAMGPDTPYRVTPGIAVRADGRILFCADDVALQGSRIVACGLGFETFPVQGDLVAARANDLIFANGFSP